MLFDKSDNNRKREWVGTTYMCAQNFQILRKMYIFCLNLLHYIHSRHFVQHADVELNVSQVALTFCEMQLISFITLSTFMSVIFGSWLKEIFNKMKIATIQYSIIHGDSFN